MTNLQDIVVKEMKVKKHIDSQQESREMMFQRALLTSFYHLEDVWATLRSRWASKLSPAFEIYQL